ncbi:MAG TPA: hypothetical protein PKD61_16250, partial [Polyangiaceae bacterium]|nr:hypothetical protein [Polyangiaceae bacterium]
TSCRTKRREPERHRHSTYVIPRLPGSMLQPSVWNETASYLRSFGAGNGQVEVANLVAGETKLAFRYTPDKLMNSVSKTVMGPRHVFWIYTGGFGRAISRPAK